MLHYRLLYYRGPLLNFRFSILKTALTCCGVHELRISVSSALLRACCCCLGLLEIVASAVSSSPFAVATLSASSNLHLSRTTSTPQDDDKRTTATSALPASVASSAVYIEDELRRRRPRRHLLPRICGQENSSLMGKVLLGCPSRQGIYRYLKNERPTAWSGDVIFGFDRCLATFD